MFRHVKNYFMLLAFLAIPVSTFAAYVTSTVPPGGSTASASNFVGRTINVMDFGAQCNAASGQVTTFSGYYITATGTWFYPTDVSKAIVISGAGYWTLVGNFTSGSPEIYNVNYQDANGNLHPSLIGASAVGSAAANNFPITGPDISTSVTPAFLK
jgi:hypothetical protein